MTQLPQKVPDGQTGQPPAVTDLPGIVEQGCDFNQPVRVYTLGDFRAFGDCAPVAPKDAVTKRSAGFSEQYQPVHLPRKSDAGNLGWVDTAAVT